MNWAYVYSSNDAPPLVDQFADLTTAEEARPDLVVVEDKQDVDLLGFDAHDSSTYRNTDVLQFHKLFVLKNSSLFLINLCAISGFQSAS